MNSFCHNMGGVVGQLVLVGAGLAAAAATAEPRRAATAAERHLPPLTTTTGPEEGAPIGGHFEEYVLALEFQPAWSQGDCASNVTKHLNGSRAARGLSIHGLWPNFDSTHEYSWPQFCKNASLDYTACTGAAPPSYCAISATTRAEMDTAWSTNYPEYVWSDLASHEWAKHGSCAGFDDQLAYFRAVDERVTPKLAGAGAALVASSVGANVSYASLRAAFLRDSDGKDVALGCEGCNLSDVWFKVDSVTFAPVDYGGESTCAKCADVHVIDFAAEGCK